MLKMDHHFFYKKNDLNLPAPYKIELLFPRFNNILEKHLFTKCFLIFKKHFV